MGPSSVGLVSVSKGKIVRPTDRYTHIGMHNTRIMPREGKDGNPGDASIN